MRHSTMHYEAFEGTVCPSTRPIRPLPKASKWKGAQNFEKEVVVEKKIVSNETPKNLIHSYNQKTKNLEHSCKH